MPAGSVVLGAPASRFLSLSDGIFPGPRPMNTLTKRAITAVVLAVVVLAALLVLPSPTATVLIACLLMIGCWEWGGFFAAATLVRVLYVLAALVLLALWTASWPAAVAPATVMELALLWWLLAAVWLYAREIRYSKPLAAIAGYLCLLPAWIALTVILAAERGAWLLVWLMAIVAAADIGAYFSGKALGRNQLAPLLSPGKTIEGLAGGLLAAALAAAGGAAMLGLDWLPFALFGPLLAALSVVGDLTVSAFKRNAGLKDTGRLLPGHGGIMDRIDSLVAAAPGFALILAYLGVLTL